MLQNLKGLGEKRLELLRLAGIESVDALAAHVPKDYRVLSNPLAIAALAPGRQAAFFGVVETLKARRMGKTVLVIARVKDEGASVQLCWYGQKWILHAVKKGERYLFWGRPQRRKGVLEVVQPVIADTAKGEIQPLYGMGTGLSDTLMQSLALQAVEQGIKETLPVSVREKNDLLPLQEALLQAHAPQDTALLQKARYRLAFEEWLLYQVAAGGTRQPGQPMAGLKAHAEYFLSKLPFSPTGAQQRVLFEMADDMARPRAMARLLQGDVGSGKTAVAFGAMYAAAQSGFQCALMAPTDILARQHLQSAKKMLEPLGITCGLVLGGMSAGERKAAKAAMASGEWQVIIGTHALFSKWVGYQALGLVIVDEQHRFGVKQRAALCQKGEKDGALPHVLAMSATPIPRTLAIALYGNMDISVLDERPAGRQPIQTRLVPQNRREGLYTFAEAKLSEGAQAYVVCPLVEESETLDILDAKTMYEDLQARFKPCGYEVGLVHGKQPQAEREAVLKAFAEGSVHVLVCTTVVEVGIDVPNAALIIIEDAARFGLAQLHQLRGRVGRGSKESWCFLLDEPNERLKALVESQDGFRLAELDLEQRGPGQLLGVRQHGMPEMPETGDGTALLESARLAAQALSANERAQLEPIACAK